MSDAIAAIGSAAVTTVGTVAVAGMATKAITRATGGMGGTRTRKSGNYKVFHGTKHRGSTKRSKSLMGW